MPRLILVGQVAGAVRVRGEVKIGAHTADPLSLIAYSPLLDETGAVALTLQGGRAVKGSLITRAGEVATREEAEALRGLRLYIDRAALPPPDEEEYYFTDLVGSRRPRPRRPGPGLGEVGGLRALGDLLEIAPADGAPPWWSPFTRGAVPEVNLAEGWVVVVRTAESD